MSHHNHDKQNGEYKVIYTCPMHPEIKRDRPGMCFECGMNLVRARTGADGARTHAEHNKHEGHSTEMFFKKFWVSLILTVPVVLYSDIVEKILGWKAPDFLGSAYMPLVFGSVVFFY